MNAVEQLYRNAGLITEDGYVKVNDKLWISLAIEDCAPTDLDYDLVPTWEEAHCIQKKLPELITIQDSCGKQESLRSILSSLYPSIWIGKEYDFNLISGCAEYALGFCYRWWIKVRRSP